MIISVDLEGGSRSTARYLIVGKGADCRDTDCSNSVMSLTLPRGDIGIPMIKLDGNGVGVDSIEDHDC